MKKHALAWSILLVFLWIYLVGKKPDLTAKIDSKPNHFTSEPTQLPQMQHSILDLDAIPRSPEKKGPAEIEETQTRSPIQQEETFLTQVLGLSREDSTLFQNINRKYFEAEKSILNKKASTTVRLTLAQLRQSKQAKETEIKNFLGDSNYYKYIEFKKSLKITNFRDLPPQMQTDLQTFSSD